MTRVVLGSASAGRLAVLRKAGIDPLVMVSGVDEEAVIAALGEHVAAERVVSALAVAKADAVAATLDTVTAADCVVLSCDSMLELDSRLCGKPESADAARAQWTSMAGRSGLLHTGHRVLRVIAGDVVQRETDVASTTVHFAVPSPGELEAYLGSGEPLGVAGGFTIDGLGGFFVEAIEGDPSNVVGLSLPLLRRLLDRVGISPADLWAPPA